MHSDRSDLLVSLIVVLLSECLSEVDGLCHNDLSIMKVDEETIQVN